MTAKEQFGEFDFVNDEDRGAQNLHEWLKFSPNVKALVNSIMPEIQEVHDAQSDLYTKINIFDAVGSQLDDIFGNLLETPREIGQSDTSYRTTLLGATTKFSGAGEIVVMKNLFKTFVSATRISLIEYNPATFIMNAQVPVPNDVDISSVSKELKKTKQGGTEMDLTISIDTTPFSFISVGDTPDATLGFASLASPTAGGTLGSVIPRVFEYQFLLTNDNEYLTTNDGKKLVFYGGV